MNLTIIEEFVKSKLENEPSGHDYLHAIRVKNNALQLMEKDVEQEVVLASCLIHDLIDYKLDPQFKATKEGITGVLKTSLANSRQIEMIFDIIQNISFSKGNTPSSKEGKIVQDADRLDALGAIGIARTFSYGGKNNRLIYQGDTIDGTDSVSHFYQKLLHLADLMNTEKGHIEAVKRTDYMKEYLNKLYKEIGMGDKRNAL